MDGNFLVGTEPVGGIVKAVLDFLVGWMADMLHELISGLMNLLVEMMAYNPDLSVAYGLWNEVRTIVNGFFVLTFVLAGIAMLAGSIMGSPPGRLIKQWLLKTLASIVLVNASFDLYSLIVGLEGALVRELLFTNLDIGGFVMAGATAILILFIDSFLVLGVILVFIIRHVLVLAGAVFFPMILFLWLLPPSRRIGSALLTLTFIIIFLPFAEALCLKVAMLAFSSMGGSFSGTLFNGIFGLGAMGMMILVPLVLFKIGLSVSTTVSHVAESPRHAIRTVVTRIKENSKKEDTSYIG